MDDQDFKDFVLLRQGAEARLHIGDFLGQKAIVKERFSKKYRHPQLDERLTKERLKGEVRSLMRCKMVGIRTPTIYHLDMDNGILVMEYLNSAPTCRDYIENLLNDTDCDNVDKVNNDIGSVLI